MATSYELFTQRRALLVKELYEVIDDIVRRHIELGQKASGDFIKSLEVRETEKGAELWGIDYTKYLVNGRRPGKMPPKVNIVQWMQDKFHYSKEQAEKIAFPIMKKIADEGTDIYKKGGTDLIESVITDARVDAIMEKIGVLTKDFYKSKIRDDLKMITV